MPVLLALLAGLALADEPTLEIPYEKYELENGLDVILAPDNSTPIVYVNVWYHVGSKDEKPGLTGFAHLFEHLMFQGSEHANGEYFTPLSEVGGEVNGSTNVDRTNYYEQVPAEYLPLALFLESDRMGWLLPVLDQDRLDNQREVVRNERRQRYEITPYGEAWKDLTAAVYPEGHPYHHPTIGSHEDLQAAKLEDVKAFFETWYGPQNASLVIAGDFDSAKAKELVEFYFGDIPRGPDPVQLEPTTTTVKAAEIRQFQKVPEQKFWAAYASPKIYAEGDAALDILSSVLSDGQDSRLYKKLVLEDQIAKEISVGQVSRGLESFWMISGTAAKGHTTDEVLAAADAVIADVLGDNPPTDEEVAAAKSQFEVGFYQRIRTIGGKGDLLNGYNFHTGDPGYIGKDLARYLPLTPKDVVSAGKQTLGGERVVLHIWPESDKPADEEGK
ncbi:MAG: insulinase family protein [Deltaproteobacteria bacterium]|nr:MAG: insulinase family protein [Deltaproteobacteria bacterium]